MPAISDLPRASILRHPPGGRSPRRPHVSRRATLAGDGRASHLGVIAAEGSDEELLARYRDARRPEDFDELVRRHSGPLGRHLARYLGDATLAEDVLQETFALVFSRCGLYKDGWPARPWLFAIATRRAIDTIRRSRRFHAASLDSPVAVEEENGPGTLVDLLAAPGPGPLETLGERERHHWVRDRVAGLPEPFRRALVQVYYKGMSYAEVAERERVPLGTIKSRLHGAIEKLRAEAERTDFARGR